MLQIVTHTPPWVFALLVGLLVFGFVQTRDRNVKRFAAYLLPVGMIALSIAGVQSSFGFTLVPVALWAAGLVVTTLIGFRFFRDKRVSFVAGKKSFYIPGSWAPLVVIMAIFFTKYAVAVMLALKIEMATSPVFAMALSLAYGCFSGYFAARAVNLVAQTKAASDGLTPQALGESA